MNKKILIGVALLILSVGFWALTQLNKVDDTIQPTTPVIDLVEVPTIATSSTTVIGSSIEGRDITVHTFGTGEEDLLFVGGVHGGYEWNSILLANEMVDYWQGNSGSIPANITLHIIPNLNPDGLFAATSLEGRFSATDITDNSMHTTGAGRFNANDVDLNRNFGCKWAPESSWRGNVVSAGTEAFSEPEAQALRDYVMDNTPEAVVFWHSQANNVYASECENGALPETLTVMNAYAKASGYGAVPVFDAYPITGDAEGWLASIGIPAVTVELETRTSIEWERNLAGTNAILNWYGK